MNRLLAIARKEFLHIVYDFRTLFILFMMPVVQLVMFGYALNLEIQKVDLAVMDHAHSPASQDMVDGFRGSTFFRVFFYRGIESEIEHLFQSRQARAVLVIPREFGQKSPPDTVPDVQVIVDASDPNAAQVIRNYCTQVIQQYNGRQGRPLPFLFDFRPAILFNPDLKSTFFFVPGVIAMILIMISALLTSIAITREKETGTMEQILVSPVRSYEIILGKVLPYIFLAFLDAAMIVGVGLYLFDVPFRGSWLLLVGLTLLYITTALSLGLMISTRAKTQQVAMMAALFATLMPTIMLSGLIFPISSMPVPLQYVTQLIPARYYLLIVRGVMLKGSSFAQLVVPAMSLAIMSLVLLLVSIRRFRTTLEG